MTYCTSVSLSPSRWDVVTYLRYLDEVQVKEDIDDFLNTVITHSANTKQPWYKEAKLVLDTFFSKVSNITAYTHFIIRGDIEHSYDGNYVDIKDIIFHYPENISKEEVCVSPYCEDQEFILVEETIQNLPLQFLIEYDEDELTIFNPMKKLDFQFAKFKLSKNKPGYEV